MIPTLLEYLDRKEVKDPEEEEDIASLGVIAFFGEPQAMTQVWLGNSS